jgi:2-phosphosulfolactate phosphatase
VLPLIEWKKTKSGKIAINVQRKTLESCVNPEGVVVVVDVLRAFTTTAYAFDRGASEIFLVSTIDEAFELREQYPDLLLAGEVNGYSIKGFDLPNSPSVIKSLNLTNQPLALRTTAGTQGVVLAQTAAHLYVASLSVATATAKSIKKLEHESITFADTGIKSKGSGDDDIACSD